MNISNTNLPSVKSIENALKTEQKSSSNSVENIGKTFGQVLQDLSAQEVQTNNMLESLAAGEDVELHEIMIAAEQTDVNFRVALSIRDKLVEAYKEVMRMQV
ncbi:MAG: flagellar hook-basal body complex protein FliE [Anaerolineaceae bacterium]|nr:flagellar hook-basal body complex protein FliE [Anaerolineaceae bacterium]